MRRERPSYILDKNIIAFLDRTIGPGFQHDVIGAELLLAVGLATRSAEISRGSVKLRFAATEALMSKLAGLQAEPS